MILPSSCYSLEAVAKRWNCDVRTLLLFACDGTFAIALPPEIDGKFYYVPNLRDFLQAKPDEKIEVVLVCATPEAARGIIRDDSGNIITDTALEAMPYEERKEILRKLGKATTPRLEDNRFTLTELVITYEELERVERETKEVAGQTSKNSSPIKPNQEQDGSVIRPRKQPKRFRNPGSFLDTVTTFFENIHKRTPTRAELWASLQTWDGAEIVERNQRELKLYDGTEITQAKLQRWFRDTFGDINDINDISDD